MALITNMPQGYGIKGKRQEVHVSATAQVYKGEFVNLLPEYVPQGSELRWGFEDVHILAAKELSDRKCLVVFTQYNETKAKVLAYDKATGAVELGNTLVLAEEAVTEAAATELAGGKAVVIYPSEGASVAAVITVEGRMSTLSFTDIWYEQELDNLCVCAMKSDLLLLSGMNRSGEAWVRVGRVDADSLSAYNYDAVRVDMGNDTDVYAGGWSMEKVTDTTAVLAAPVALDKPISMAVLDLVSGASYALPACKVRLITAGKYANSLPTIAVCPLRAGKWAVAYGIGWLSPDKNVVKSTVAIEVWGLNRYAAELLWYGCEDVRYASSIGGVHMEPIGGAGAAVSYTGETKGRCIHLSTEDGILAGPAAPMEPNDGFCSAVPVMNHIALLVTQRKGNGYVQVLQCMPRAVPADGHNDGLALSGGGPGETITVIG